MKHTLAIQFKKQILEFLNLKIKYNSFELEIYNRRLYFPEILMYT